MKMEIGQKRVHSEVRAKIKFFFLTHTILAGFTLESVQDFLIKLDIKSYRHLSSRNKHFFTKSWHRQTFQNYEQPP